MMKLAGFFTTRGTIRGKETGPSSIFDNTSFTSTLGSSFNGRQIFDIGWKDRHLHQVTNISYEMSHKVPRTE